MKVPQVTPWYREKSLQLDHGNSDCSDSIYQRRDCRVVRVGDGENIVLNVFGFNHDAHLSMSRTDDDKE